MLILDASRRNRPVPGLARWCLGAGISATIGANLAHGLGHGPIGALVSAWPVLALAGSFELLMLLVRNATTDQASGGELAEANQAVRGTDLDVPPALVPVPTLERTVRDWHQAGRSQRAIARELNLDRRKVKRILDYAI